MMWSRGKMRMVGVGRCKNGAYPRRRPWEFASVRLDEAPTELFYGLRGGCSWWGRRSRRSTDVLSAGEGLDDEHRCAAVSAHEGGSHGADADVDCGGLGGNDRGRLMQQFTRRRDLVFAVGVSEQSIVADAMKSGGQHVQQEAAHELLGTQRHCFVAGSTVSPVVLPAEGDAAIVQCNKP